MDIPLTTKSACLDFINNSSPQIIAQRLRFEQELCRHGRLPSLLALYLPEFSPDIALHLLDGKDRKGKVHPRVLRFHYTTLVANIKAYLRNMEVSPHIAEIIQEAEGEEVEAGNVGPKLDAAPSAGEITTALRVLEHFERRTLTPFTAATPLIQIQHILRAAQAPQPTSFSHSTFKHKKRKCYVCRYVFPETHAHPQYPSLCVTCGEFNLSCSALSLPGSLALTGKTALVTGARVNLGFCVTLRLLRCGASVLATTRYPHDALVRYVAEPDYGEWKDRLRVVGADFRTAKDVFVLVGAVKAWLTEGKGKLDILVNNAAQTLTDSLAAEQAAVEREKFLLPSSGGRQLLLSGDVKYEPKVRGGLGSFKEQLLLSSGDDGREAARSSWTQRLEDIPYEDVVTAQSVNAFVPLILVNELLPLMSSSSPSHSSNGSSEKEKIEGYIINVSSRESIFEALPGHRAKAGTHVHTNMSKAALNMLTETEAAKVWAEKRVAMCTVDPGYMSADPAVVANVRQGGKEWVECPLGWEDGAGRVLWPAYVGEMEGRAVWGRFLKHYGAVKVDVAR